MQAARKELEAEKARMHKALDESKKRLAKATKSQHAAEVAAAEVCGCGWCFYNLSKPFLPCECGCGWVGGEVCGCGCGVESTTGLK